MFETQDFSLFLKLWSSEIIEILLFLGVKFEYRVTKSIKFYCWLCCGPMSLITNSKNNRNICFWLFSTQESVNLFPLLTMAAG